MQLGSSGDVESDNVSLSMLTIDAGRWRHPVNWFSRKGLETMVGSNPGQIGMAREI